MKIMSIEATAEDLRASGSLKDAFNGLLRTLFDGSGQQDPEPEESKPEKPKPAKKKIPTRWTGRRRRHSVPRAGAMTRSGTSWGSAASRSART